MNEARTRFVLETVATLSRMEQTLESMRRLLNGFLLWMCVFTVLFHLIGLPTWLPLVLAVLALLIIKATAIYFRRVLGTGIRMVNLKLRRVTLGVAEKESAARFEFEDGEKLWLMDLDVHERRAVKSLAGYNGTSLYILTPCTSLVPFQASVNRGRHFFWGVALSSVRGSADLRDLLDRNPGGNDQLILGLIEETRRTLQWGLRGVELNDLRTMFARSYLLTGMPYGVKILFAIALPSRTGR